MTRNSDQDPSPALTRALRGTLTGLWAERLARGFWPFMTLVLACGAALGLGLQDALPGVWAAGLAFAAGTGLVATLGYGLWRLELPTRAQAAARLDGSMPGRPLSTLADAQAIGAGDAASRADAGAAGDCARGSGRFAACGA